MAISGFAAGSGAGISGLTAASGSGAKLRGNGFGAGRPGVVSAGLGRLGLKNDGAPATAGTSVAPTVRTPVGPAITGCVNRGAPPAGTMGLGGGTRPGVATTTGGFSPGRTPLKVGTFADDGTVTGGAARPEPGNNPGGGGDTLPW